jgi:hypothetical protein
MWKPNADFVWLDSKRGAYIPDVMLPLEMLPPASMRVIVPLCGYGFVLAVSDGACWVGFVNCETLGFDSAREWALANHWVFDR